jgi:hypothetical protein
MTVTHGNALENRCSTAGEPLVEFIRKLTADAFDGPERRSEPRHALLVSIQAQVVDANGRRIGSPISGISRDLSASGISILTAGPINGQFLQIQLTRKEVGTIELTMEVLRSRPIGPFIETAGRFLPTS